VYDAYALPEDCGKRITEAAWAISGEFDGHSDPQDLAQTIWLWIGSYPKQSAKWWYTATDGTQKFSWVQFKRDIRRVAAEQARRDKRARLGIVLEDEVGYSTSAIERFLPFVWHSDVLSALDVVDDGQPKARTDKATTGDSMVSAMDVRTAYESVIDRGSDWDKTLFLLYGMMYTQQEAADALGIERSWLGRRAKKALQAIADELNGTPGGKEYSLWPEGPGTRKATSNAQAQTQTDRETGQ
jgi:DNA-directed RNA polymerase specialized sigma24 family protein